MRDHHVHAFGELIHGFTVEVGHRQLHGAVALGHHQPASIIHRGRTNDLVHPRTTAIGEDLVQTRNGLMLETLDQITAKAHRVDNFLLVNVTC
jgi:hypothetical protein